MKTIWRFFIAIWLLAWTALGLMMYVDTPRQIEKDKIFKTANVDPIVEATKSFIAMNNRIPTTKEFNDLNDSGNGELITDFGNLPPEFQDKITIEEWDGDTYAIAVWRGEWNEGYISKNDIYILNDYSWTEGFKGLLKMIAIGLFPVALTMFATKRKSRTSGSA